MPPLSRRIGVSALLAPLVLAAAGCGGPSIELKSSDRLDALLIPETAYPDGYDVETRDVTEASDTPSSQSYDRIEPTQCADAMADNQPDQVPDGSAAGAIQTAKPGDSSDADTFYTFILAEGEFSGDDGEAPDTDSMDRFAYACSDFTGYVDDVEVEGSVERMASDDLPEGSDGFLMTIEADRMRMSTRAAWGEVSGVYYVLMGINVNNGSGPSPDEVARECYDVAKDSDHAMGSEATQCFDDYRQKVADDEAAQQQEEFDGILSKGVEQLG
ncbi:hypothetical protein GCM10009799_41010 [Nocardiopsis rhodophaea]|uniref:Lipoprotein n=1 Tax=Nocardiopsis rhodophaea TaxID=280238 RepID=A0ABN2TH38_9ACTN